MIALVAHLMFVSTSHQKCLRKKLILEKYDCFDCTLDVCFYQPSNMPMEITDFEKYDCFDCTFDVCFYQPSNMPMKLAFLSQNCVIFSQENSELSVPDRQQQRIHGIFIHFPTSSFRLLINQKLCRQTFDSFPCINKVLNADECSQNYAKILTISSPKSK